MHIDGYDIDILVQGFPGKSVCHGGLGWSTVVLLRGGGRVVIVDTGSFNMRRLIGDQLTRRGLTPTDVTDVILTHAHYDHSINWIMFPHARVAIGAAELDWAASRDERSHAQACGPARHGPSFAALRGPWSTECLARLVGRAWRAYGFVQRVLPVRCRIDALIAGDLRPA